MTYRGVWRQARAGAYGDPSLRGALAVWRDLITASTPVLRPAMMLAVLGWGAPRIAEEWRAFEAGAR